MIEEDNGAHSKKMRVDKWLWHARFFKTRALSQTFVTKGKLRVNGARIKKASHNVATGDVLSFSIGSRVFLIEVLGCPERRGPATEAAQFYINRDLV